MPLDLAFSMMISFFGAMTVSIAFTIWVGQELWKLFNKHLGAIWLSGFIGLIACGAVCVMFAGVIVALPA